MTKRLLTSRVTRADAAGKQADLPDVPLSLPGVSPTAVRLLKAGAEAFAERGFHATTTRDIASRVGLSPAGLYVHYPSKGALLAHLSVAGHEAALALVDGTLAGDDPVPERLHAMVTAFVTWHAEHHLVARVVQYELRSLDAETLGAVSALRRRMENRVEEVVREGVEDGSLRVPHPRQATRAILSLAVDVARWFDPRGRDSAADTGGVYADLALRMLGAEPRGVAPGTQEPSQQETRETA
jgi:AcrR family transcriptional regulator